MKSYQTELDDIYESIGNGAECTDELLERIKELEDIINPKPVIEKIEKPLVYCNPYCNGLECWECAAIRGGDPMDV